MTEFWGEPRAFHLLWLVPVWLLASLYARSKRRRAAEAFAAGEMGARVLPPCSAGRFWLKTLLFAGGLVAGIMALARPRFGEYFETVRGRGGDVYVLVDVSRSMLAEDVKPSRLERAKSDVKSLLRRLRDERVGLIAFAGKAVVKCPLTTDRDFFRETLEELSPASAPLGGTAVGDAINKALRVLPKHAERDQALVLITDGEDHDSYPKKSAATAAKRHIRIFTVGLGDPKHGARIPCKTNLARPAADYLVHKGKQVWSRLNEQLLREIALTTGGAYVNARTHAYDLGKLYKEHLSKMQGKEAEERTRRRQYERFYIPLAVALAAFLLNLLLSPYPAPPPAAEALAAAAPTDKSRRRSRKQSADDDSAAKPKETVAATKAGLLLVAALLLPPPTLRGTAKIGPMETAEAAEKSHAAVKSKQNTGKKEAGAENVSPADAPHLVADGLRLFSAGKYKEAAKRFALADTALPENPLVAFDRGRARHAAGDYKQAQDCYMRATDARNRRLAARAWYALGCLKSDRAAKAADKKPAAVNDETWAAVVADLLDAIRCWRRCRELIPDHVEAKHNIETARLWLKYWRERRLLRKRKERREKTDLLSFLEYLIAAQDELRRCTTTLPPPQGTALNEYAETRRAQKQLAEEIPTLNEKIDHALAVQPPPNSVAGAPKKKTDNEASRQREALRKKLLDRSADAALNMSRAVEYLEAAKAQPAAENQNKAVRALRQIWEKIVPFDKLLAHDITRQTEINTTLEKTAGRTGTGEKKTATGSSPSTPLSTAKRKTPPAPKTTAAEAKGEELAPEQEETARLTDLLAGKAAAMLWMLKAAAKKESAAPVAPPSPVPGKPGQGPGTQKPKQPKKPTAAEELKKWAAGLQKGVELSPKAAAAMREAAVKMRAEDLTDAAVKGKKALRLLLEIYKELPKKKDASQPKSKKKNGKRRQNKKQKNRRNKGGENKKNGHKQRRKQVTPEREKIERLLRLARERERRYRERKREAEAARAARSPADKDW